MNCDICFEEYDLKDFLPCILSCGHSYCKSCLESYTKKFAELSNYLKCPRCKNQSIISIVNNKISFTKNYSLISILESKNKDLTDLKTSEDVKKSNTLKIISNIFDLLQDQKKENQKISPHLEKEYKFSHKEEYLDRFGNMDRVHCEFPVPQEFNFFQVEIKVETRDQGWASSDCSGSWITVKLIDFSGNAISEFAIWENLRVQQYTWRTKVFTEQNQKEDEDVFFKNIKKAKVIQILAHSKYPGWKCHTRGVEIIFKGLGYKNKIFRSRSID